ncbi:Ribosome production factor 1 [Sparganum proliferum]
MEVNKETTSKETIISSAEILMPLNFYRNSMEFCMEVSQSLDEFTRIYSNEVEPKLLLTHSDRVSPRTVGFCKELARVIPNMTVAPRWHAPLKKLIPKAIEHGYTAVLVLNEDMKKINTLVISHLPHGPTATFRLSNVIPRRKIRGLKHKGIEPGVVPHLILNRFMTRLGRRVERILGALFPAVSRGPPQPHCRTVVFHNQRDFIFFRHYRYQHKRDRFGQEEETEEAGTPATGLNDRVVTNEVGPRFTLKLRSIQMGTFDSQFGDYEWVRKTAVIGKSRRTFVL